MPNSVKVIIFSAIAFLVSSGATANDSEIIPVEVGRNSAVKGDVKIQSLTDIAARQALVKEPVFLGDNVNSRIGSSLQVLLKDSSIFTVGPQCDMTIDKFVYDPEKNNNSMSAKVKKGMFRFTSGKVSKTNPDKITVTTPTATMGIRGTIVEVLVGPEAFLCAEKEGLVNDKILMDHMGATLIILRGPGENNTTANRRGEVEVTAGGETVLLTQAGMGVLVSNKDQKPSEPFEISEPLFNYFNRRLRTIPTKSGNFRPFKIESNWFTPIPPPLEEEEEIEFISPMDSIGETDWPSSIDDELDNIDLDTDFDTEQ